MVQAILKRHLAGLGFPPLHIVVDLILLVLHLVLLALRESIVSNGHKMRVYVPFGKKWFGYSTRRLKENPKMASHIIKAIFVKG